MAGRTWQIVDADPEQNELVVAPVSQLGALLFGRENCHQSPLTSPPRLVDYGGGFWICWNRLPRKEGDLV